MSLIGIYYTEPTFRNIFGRTVSEPVAGVNPIDVGLVTLKNIRGQTRYEITSGDNNYTSSFEVSGGLGTASLTQNFWFVEGTNIGCTVKTPFTNTLQITTPLADAGGRVYQIIFYPYNSLPPKISKTAGNAIGDFNAIITIYKTSIAWA